MSETSGSKLVVYTDGGARGNPGPAALGVAIYSSSGKLLRKYGEHLGDRTNNEAEYEAIISALKTALALGAKIVDCYMDSEFVVRQLAGIYKVREPRMKALFAQVKNLEIHFHKVSYTHIPRAKNKLADQMVNAALDKAQGL